jgi:hemolysin activation/secretion protein
LMLGGDTGLRGYPLRYQGGQGRWLMTLEQRAFTDWYPFRLVHVGAAAFLDVGGTWGRDPYASKTQGVLGDVGVGLRLGNSRSALGNVLHIDLAFPVNGDKSIKNMQVIVETKRSF